MAFTSGTTGNPKCVLHSFNTTLPAVRQINRRHAGDRNGRAARLSARVPQLGLPLSPAGDRRAAAGRCCSSASRRRPLWTDPAGSVSPTSLRRRPRSSRCSTSLDLSDYDVSSLRVVITGGASAAIETIRDYPGAHARSSDRALRHAGDGLSHLHALHRTIPQRSTGRSDESSSMGLKILDEAGARGAAGRGGRDRRARAQRASRLPRQCAANAEAFTADGWFRTGDLGRIVDRRGNVEIVGRRKEIINRGGKKFFPREVEELLYTHPRSCTRPWLASPMRASASATACASSRRPASRVTLAETGRSSQGPGRRLQAARADAHRR